MNCLNHFYLAIGLDIPASNQHTFPIKNMYINYDTNEDDSFIKHLRNTGDNYKYDFDGVFYFILKKKSYCLI